MRQEVDITVAWLALPLCEKRHNKKSQRMHSIFSDFDSCLGNEMSRSQSYLELTWWAGVAGLPLPLLLYHDPCVLPRKRHTNGCGLVQRCSRNDFHQRTHAH